MPVGKVLCLGDSQTAGSEQNPTGFRSYRGPLLQRLQAAGYTVDFVGTQLSVPASGGTDGDHDGYGGARMRSADSATNSIEGRLSTIRSAIGAVDIIILLIGWNDVYQATASIDTKYIGLLPLIQTGTWSSAKVVMVTLSPEPGKSTAQTGSDYPEYAALNSAIRGSTATSRVVADLAGLTTSSSADRDAMVEKLLYDVKHGPDSTTRADGSPMPAVAGGHMITSFKSIQDFCAQWRATPWRIGGNGGTAGLSSDPSVRGHPYFVNTVHALAPWLWVFAAPGHASTNTVVEARNMFAQAWRGSTNQWEFFYEGARPGVTDDNSAVYDATAQVLRGHRPDGITSFYRVSGGANIEAWAGDTVPSRGITQFLGGSNRSLMTDAVCFAIGVELRLALLDPNGTNDIALARYQVGCGFDAFAGGATRYDYYGWPLEMMDGGHDRWQILRSTEWTPVGAISIGRTTPTWQGINDTEHFEDPGTMPPHSRDWSPAMPFNDIGTYSKTQSEVRANPPRLPQYWSGSGTTGRASAWVPADYWYNPTLGGLDIHWSQQGADRAAGVIYDAMLRAGWLSTFTSGGGEPVIPSPLPGAPAAGRWSARFTTEATTPATGAWASMGPTQSVAPAFSTQGLATAVVGSAYAGSVSATGTPAPTYSIVSGAPAWLAINSTTGALSNTGSVTGDEDQSYSVTFRATNAVDSVDVTLVLRVIVGVSIVSTSPLPGAVSGTAYMHVLQAAGSGPFTWSVVSGEASLASLGLSLSAGGAVGGTIGTGTATFTARATGPTGLTADRAFTVTGSAIGSAPVITTTSLPSGTVDTAYSGTVAATGSGTITRRAITPLPPGLTITPTTGVITGTVTQPGGYFVTFEADNGIGTPARVTLLISIQPAGGAALAPSPWTGVRRAGTF